MTLRMKVICQMVDDNIIVALLTMFSEVVLKRGGINFQGKQEYLNTFQYDKIKCDQLSISLFCLLH